ncbi:hypothetical protein MNB_ARC-1_1262 [hydrothermal vent metagenome]|uniref:Tetratricopeptide repeat-like domain-containing protein n=1 Tax=hydrothermal vent metagenome TaxID=652676 RepID=A0A3B1DTV8_9ZZZZ
MSLKENINFFKQEISTEEKFFEGFFKIETFWKKYKIVIIVVVFVTLILTVGTNINKYIQMQNKIKSNLAFDALLENPKDEQSKTKLKNLNLELFKIANYINKQDKQIDVEFFKEISQFNKAIENNDIKQLDKLILNPNFILQDYALFQKALILTANKDYQNAKKTVGQISQLSGIYNIANKLKHHLLTK